MKWTFSFQNITDQVVPLRGLSASVTGFTQIDAFPTKAAKIGPHQSMEVWPEFKLGPCSELYSTAAAPRIRYEYEVDGTRWKGSIMSPTDHWVHDAVTRACS